MNAGRDAAPSDAERPEGGTGGSDVGPSDAPEGDSRERVIFMTKGEHTGDLGGLAGADKLCNDEGATGLERVRGREYLAWLSTSETPAATRHVHGRARYLLPSGETVAENWAALMSGELQNAIRQYPNGSLATPDWYPWTGTLRDGRPASDTCNDWTSSEQAVDGRVGQCAEIGPRWTDQGSTPCDDNHTIYCIEK